MTPKLHTVCTPSCWLLTFCQLWDKREWAHQCDPKLHIQMGPCWRETGGFPQTRQPGPARDVTTVEWLKGSYWPKTAPWGSQLCLLFQPSSPDEFRESNLGWNGEKIKETCDWHLPWPLYLKLYTPPILFPINFFCFESTLSSIIHILLDAVFMFTFVYLFAY